MNNIFKYKNLLHAFSKEIRNNGFSSLYIGISPFLMTYCSFIAIQFAIYEKIIDIEKKRKGMDKYRQDELMVNCYAGFFAGCIAAALTNSLEAITVAKQTNPSINIMQMIREENTKLLHRGLMARVAYNGGQAFVFFSLLLQMSKVFNVELSD